MCVVSMITDHYIDKWPRRLRPYEVYPSQDWPNQPPTTLPPQETVDEQAERMRKYVEQQLKPKPAPITSEEIAEFRELMKRAKEYDKRNNEPHCEEADKIAKLKSILNRFVHEDQLTQEQFNEIMEAFN